MATFFLLLIYLAFISLGLPDPMLGAAWPVMRTDLNISLDGAGWLSMLISAGTIVSSLASAWLVRRFGTGKVTVTSVLATALALLGFGLVPSYNWMLLLTIPLGLGAGAIDAALNNYVALHYEAKHMSWLHCFWGVGTLIGPLIMSFWLQADNYWRGGYLTIGAIQMAVFLLLLLSLPLWRKNEATSIKDISANTNANNISSNLDKDSLDSEPAQSVFKIPGVKSALLTFFCYCAAEWTPGLWVSSYLVESGYSEIWAARGAAVYFAGITGGRFVNGFLASRFSGATLIRAGVLLIIVGAVLTAVPAVSFLGILVAGLGMAPVYPCMIHETPRRFGAANSQKIIGLQMATAYTGTTIFPPLLGWVAAHVGIWIFPYAILIVAVLMLICSENIERACRLPTKS